MGAHCSAQTGPPLGGQRGQDSVSTHWGSLRALPLWRPLFHTYCFRYSKHPGGWDNWPGRGAGGVDQELGASVV